MPRTRVSQSQDIDVGDPVYRFLTQRLNVRLVHLMVFWMVINAVRNILIPMVHYHARDANYFTDMGVKDVQSLIASFIVQPLVLYVYWSSVQAIPRIYQTLWRDQTIKAKSGQSFEDFLRQVETKMTSKRYTVVMYSLIAVVLVLFHVTAWSKTDEYGTYGAYPYNLTQAIFPESFHGFLLYYFVGWGAWRVVNFAESTRLLWKSFDLEIKPYHPDEAGGLLGVGNFVFKTGWFIGAIGLFVAASIWANPHNATVEVSLLVMAVVLIAIGGAAFYYQIWPTHRVMLRARNQHQHALGESFSARWHAIHSGDITVQEEQVQELVRLMELRKINEQVIHVWPFQKRTQSVSAFYSIQIIGPILPLLVDRISPGLGSIVETIVDFL